jgi:FkbM family methyltransferase
MNKIGKLRQEIKDVDGENPGTNVCLEQAAVMAKNMFHDYATEKINVLKQDTDKRSHEVLDYVLKCMENGRFLKHARFEPKIISFPSFHRKHLTKCAKECSHWGGTYGVACGNGGGTEVFYFHHGLRFANKKIQNYVRDRDVIDGGAYSGDSLLVLRKYTNKTVYCYEFFDGCLEWFAETIKKNNIKSGYVLVPTALGETVREINNYKDSISSGTALLGSNGEKPIEMTTIDEEVKRRNIKVGFIKTDVEGYSMPVIQGAMNTIKSQRPVLSLGIYHNHEELFGVKPFLQKNLTDYVYEFHLQSTVDGDFNEMILFCYPKELAE